MAVQPKGVWEDLQGVGEEIQSGFLEIGRPIVGAVGCVMESVSNAALNVLSWPLYF